MGYEWKFCVFDAMATGGYGTEGTFYGAIVSLIGTSCRFNECDQIILLSSC